MSSELCERDMNVCHSQRAALVDHVASGCGVVCEAAHVGRWMSALGGDRRLQAEVGR